MADISRYVENIVTAWVIRILTFVCIAVVPFGIAVHWTSQTMLNTDNYVLAVRNLPRQPEVADAVAHLIVQRAVAGSFLSQSNGAPIEQTLLDAVRALIRSQQFEQVWIDANRTAHALILATFSGGIYAAGPQINTAVLDVGIILEAVGSTLQPGFPQQVIHRLATTATQHGLSVTIPVGSEMFETARWGLNVVRIADVAAPWCLLVAAGSCILLASRRRRTLVILAAGISVSCGILAMVSKAIVRVVTLDAVPESQTIARAFASSLLAPAIRQALEVGAIAASVAVLTVASSWPRSAS